MHASLYMTFFDSCFVIDTWKLSIDKSYEESFVSQGTGNVSKQKTAHLRLEGPICESLDERFPLLRSHFSWRCLDVDALLGWKRLCGHLLQEYRCTWCELSVVRQIEKYKSSSPLFSGEKRGFRRTAGRF